MFAVLFIVVLVAWLFVEPPSTARAA